jgi:uncharacterized protein (DUF2252 family)
MRKSDVCPKPDERASILEKNRTLKMARSAHAYVRGNTRQFYEWLIADAGKSVPSGPSIWICGDCHVGNLGPVANADGKVEIEIRDLDQTVIGNPAHDLIRLGLSLATAARGSDLPGVTTALMMEQLIKGYESGMNTPRAPIASSAKTAVRPINEILQMSTKRRWRNLADERIEGIKPNIPLGKRFWKLSKAETEEVDRLFAVDKVCRLITSFKKRDDKAKVKVVDSAYWLKGCSSLGRLRYAVLLSVGDKKNIEYCLVDIKEAAEAAAPAARSSKMPKDFAERVVTGACQLSPFLGERMLAEHFLKRPVVLRELMPQDLKLEIDQLTPDEAVAAASYLAAVVGKAHSRQLDAASRIKWKNELNKGRSKKLDAPGWLWNSVVELVGAHERGYLEHCRRYALGSER